MRVQIENCNEGILTRVSPEDIPKNALTWAENVTLFKKLGVVQTRDGMSKKYSPSYDGVMDIRHTNLFGDPSIFTKADSILYRGVRPIKQNLSSNRMDTTEFANWLLFCDGTNTLKYKDGAEYSWLSACCFDFEEANIPSGWSTHQSCIPFRVSQSTYYACTQDWERADLDSDSSVASDGLFFTSSCDVGYSISSTAPNANMLLHLDTNVDDILNNHAPVAFGGAAVSGTLKKFGVGSLYLDGNSDYLDVPTADDWYLHTSNFTVDFWFAIPIGSTKVEHCFFSWVDSDNGYSLWYNDQSKSFHFWSSSAQSPTTGGAFSMSFNYTITKGSFYHIAIIRGWGGNANTWAITVNGVVKAFKTRSFTIQTASVDLLIGKVDSAIDGTLRDYSSSPNVVSATNVSAESTYTKWGDLAYHNNTGVSTAALSIPQNTDVTIQADFTLDCWLRLEQLGYVTLLTSKDSFSTASEVEDLKIWLSATSIWMSIAASAGGVALYSKTDSVSGQDDRTSTWFHLAIIRVGSDWGLYINGQQLLYISESNTDTVDATAGTRMFWNDNANSRDMYMDEFRFQSGNPFSASPNSGKSDTFTTPNQRHDADDDTLLLLRPTSMDANIYLDEFRWLKGEARWTSDFDVPTGADSGTGTTVAVATSLAGDMAVPLGIDAPSSACSVNTGVAGALTGNYKYKIVFANADGFESNPSSESASVSPASEKVNLSNIPQSNNPQVTKRYIYRTEAGGSTFYYLDSIDNNHETTYTDNTADSSLGNIVETNHDAPPALQAIHSHGARIFGVTSEYPNKIVWCNAWDEWEYFDVTNYEPFGSQSDDTKGLFTLSRILVVVQGSKVWRLDTTKFPEYYWVKDQAGTIRGILSVSAAVDIGPVIFCCDAEGGFILNQSQTKSLTDRINTLFDAESSDLDSIDSDYYESLAVGYLKENLYISYTSKESSNGLNDKTIVFNYRTNKIEQIISKGFYSFDTDEKNKIIYGACTDGYLYELFSDTDSEVDSLAWEIWTKDFNGDIGPEMLLKEANFFWVDCNPNGNTITVDVYLDGSTKLGHQITGSERKVESFRLPNNQFYRMRIKFSGSGKQYLYRWAFDAQVIGGQNEV